LDAVYNNRIAKYLRRREKTREIVKRRKASQRIINNARQ
jgi:hypothetical protein